MWGKNYPEMPQLIKDKKKKKKRQMIGLIILNKKDFLSAWLL